jgi:hypothetical protein
MADCYETGKNPRLQRWHDYQTAAERCWRRHSWGYMPAALAQYQLQSISSLIGTGLNLTTRYSINPGGKDYFGTRVTASTLPVGASKSGSARAFRNIAISNFSTPNITKCYRAVWENVYRWRRRGEARRVPAKAGCAKHTVSLCW